MSSVELLRQLINERLTAAAEEIFSVCEKTLVEYQKEIDRQGRLLDQILKPQVKLHRKELLQQHVCEEEEEEEEEEVLAAQQLWNQDHDIPQLPQFKEEPEELCTSLEGGQLVLKQEVETFMVAPIYEERDNSEDQMLDSGPDDTQSAAEKRDAHIVSGEGLVKTEPEPNGDDWLLSHNSKVAELNKRRHERNNRTHNRRKTTTLIGHSNTFVPGKQLFECGTCGKTFKYKCQIKTHLRVHTGEKPYPCHTCEKRFSALRNLKEHMKIHTGEKPYLCNTCEKRFSYLSNLKYHMTLHTGEKPYPCNICQKGFSQLCNLNKHMRTHTGEKPYQCETCEKKFSCMSNLKVHMKRHTVY